MSTGVLVTCISCCGNGQYFEQHTLLNAKFASVVFVQIKNGGEKAKRVEDRTGDVGPLKTEDSPIKGGTNICETDVLDMLHSSLMKCISFRCQAALRRNRRVAKKNTERYEGHSKVSLSRAQR